MAAAPRSSHGHGHWRWRSLSSTFSTESVAKSPCKFAESHAQLRASHLRGPAPCRPIRRPHDDTSLACLPRPHRAARAGAPQVRFGRGCSLLPSQQSQPLPAPSTLSRGCRPRGFPLAGMRSLGVFPLPPRSTSELTSILSAHAKATRTFVLATRGQTRWPGSSPSSGSSEPASDRGESRPRRGVTRGPGRG